jgi:hypothetical protein
MLLLKVSVDDKIELEVMSVYHAKSFASRRVYPFNDPMTGTHVSLR